MKHGGLLAIWLSVALLGGPGLVRAAAPDAKKKSKVEEKIPEGEAELMAAVGSTVDVALRSGDTLTNVKFAGVDRNKRTGEISFFKFQRAEDDKPNKLARGLVNQVSLDGKPLLPPVEPKAKEPEKKKASNSAKGKKAAALTKKELEAQEKWLKLAAEHKVKPWPEQKPEDELKAIAELNTMVADVMKVIPGLQRYDTGQFIFVSNLPPNSAKVYVNSLDAMHKKLCSVYGLKSGAQVWLGKGLVFAFVEKSQFLLFEQRFMQSTGDVGAQGLCHSSSTGRVVISCYSGQDPAFFGQMLVHESSHGFIHRYKTPERVPSWLNEGMADWIAGVIVPEASAVRSKVAKGTAKLKSQGSVGANYWTGRNIAFDEYGIATTMVDALIKQNPKAFVAFIDGIKAGQSWEESLQENYKVSVDDFVAGYGRSIGVPGLKK